MVTHAGIPKPSRPRPAGDAVRAPAPFPTAANAVLVVDDELLIRETLAEYLTQEGFSVTTCASGEEALTLAQLQPFAVALCDVQLPGIDGIELLERLLALSPETLVLLITAFGTVENAVEAFQRGAHDYLMKPILLDEVGNKVRRLLSYRKLFLENQWLRRELTAAHDPGAIVGRGPAMRHVFDIVRKVAPTPSTVLLSGESGTGKELIARAIYRDSPRNGAPFIRVNCAAVPENLVESEFFGHEKGAFTGALNRREGRFELAHTGTLLLDEVSEIPLNLQAKLLRVLQEREFERIGGTKTIQVDVRVIASTNRHLEDSVARGEFRQDLFYRLNVVPIHVPPLRERREDIPLLAKNFLQRFARQHGSPARELSPAALAALQDHRWPGNVRELQNVIERAAILCGANGILEPTHLGLTKPITVETTPARPPSPLAQATPSASQFPTLDEVERQHILEALKRCEDNRTHAAKLLDISVRTLRNKLKEYGYGRAETEESTTPAARAG